MRARLLRLTLGALLTGTVLAVVPATAAFAFSDVTSSYWDYTAIQYVGSTNTWMQDYGTATFKPTTQEQRNFLAKTLVTIWAPNEQPDTSITIPDVPTSDPYWKYANVSIKLGWMPKYASGKWVPTGKIRVAGFDKAVVLALKLQTDVAGLQNVHEDNGTTYTVNGDFPYLNLAHVLQLHFNHTSESLDIDGNTLIARDEVAYSIWWAKTQMSWQLSHASWYADVSLPTLDTSNGTQSSQHQVTQYAIDTIGRGWPYIYAGEWNAASPNGYCCGTQPRGGFDCSGFVWWVMKKNESGYNSAQFRSYAGWPLPQRSSYDMAHNTTTHITFAQLQPGDLLLFASNGRSSWSDVDHGALWLGNHWIAQSTGSNAGVMLDSAAPGTYYYDTFVYGRRLIGSASAPVHVSRNVLLQGDTR